MTFCFIFYCQRCVHASCAWPVFQAPKLRLEQWLTMWDHVRIHGTELLHYGVSPTTTSSYLVSLTLRGPFSYQSSTPCQCNLLRHVSAVFLLLKDTSCLSLVYGANSSSLVWHPRGSQTSPCGLFQPQWAAHQREQLPRCPGFLIHMTSVSLSVSSYKAVMGINWFSSHLSHKCWLLWLCLPPALLWIWPHGLLLGVRLFSPQVVLLSMSPPLLGMSQSCCWSLGCVDRSSLPSLGQSLYVSVIESQLSVTESVIAASLPTL